MRMKKKNIKDAILKILDDPKFIDRVLKDIDKEFECQLKFLKTKKYQTIKNKLYRHLKKEGRIADDPYKEYLFDHVTNKDYCRFIDASIHNLKPEHDATEFGFPLERYFVDKFKIEIINGQGSLYCCEINEVK